MAVTSERTHALDHTDARGRAACILTIAAAVVFLAIGLVGFVITGFDDFASHHTGHTLLGFEINPLHNIVHLAFGVLGVFLWRSVRGAAAFGAVLLVGYGAAFVYGLVALDETWDVLSLNAADNWLHLALAVLGAVILALAVGDHDHDHDHDRRRARDTVPSRRAR